MQCASNYLLILELRCWRPSFRCRRRSGMNSCPWNSTLWSVKRPESRADQLQAPRLYINNEPCSQRAADLLACFSDYWKKQLCETVLCVSATFEMIVLNRSPSSLSVISLTLFSVSGLILQLCRFHYSPKPCRSGWKGKLCPLLAPTCNCGTVFYSWWIEDCEICGTEQMVFILHNIAQNKKIIYWPWCCTFALGPHVDCLALIDRL